MGAERLAEIRADVELAGAGQTTEIDGQYGWWVAARDLLSEVDRLTTERDAYGRRALAAEQHELVGTVAKHRLMEEVNAAVRERDAARAELAGMRHVLAQMDNAVTAHDAAPTAFADALGHRLRELVVGARATVGASPDAVTTEPMTAGEAWTVLCREAGRENDPEVIYSPPESLLRQARLRANPDRHGGNRTAWDRVEQAAAVFYAPVTTEGAKTDGD